MQLVWPAIEYLDGYEDALRRGWSPDNERKELAAREELARIESDPVDFVASLVDREASGRPIPLPDGSLVKRLPGYHLWLWDGDFCGSIGFRWQPGTMELPPHCLGHIGFAVVPWKRNRGYATRALQLLIPEAKKEGLEYVELTTDVANKISQKVIESNGGVFVEHFQKLEQYGGKQAIRYRIYLHEHA
jgi:predicted acetyltransferase